MGVLVEMAQELCGWNEVDGVQSSCQHINAPLVACGGLGTSQTTAALVQQDLVAMPTEQG